MQDSTHKGWSTAHGLSTILLQLPEEQRGKGKRQRLSTKQDRFPLRGGCSLEETLLTAQRRSTE